MKTKPERKTGFARIWAAFFNSLHGLRYAFSNEAAFRQELCVFIGLSLLLLFLNLPIAFKCVLFLANTLVLILELVNSAIEAVVDMVSPEYHELAKQAKDLASAAILIGLIAAAILWCCAFVSLV